MLYRLAILLCLSAAAVFSQTITIVSPNGGEMFLPGDTVDIKWNRSDETLLGIRVEYTYNGGQTWHVMGCHDENDNGLYRWSVPYLNDTTDNAIVKVSGTFVGEDLEKIFVSDESDGSFTILPTTADAYEPNNDFASAYRISLGESVIKNATVFSHEKDPNYPSSGFDTANSDWDFYVITLPENTIVTITNDPASTYGYGPSIGLFDELHRFINSSTGQVRFRCFQSGDYFIKVSSTFHYTYGLSISIIPDEFALTAPTEGETVVAGQELTIRWKKSDPNLRVSLDYSCDDGATWQKVQALNNPLDSIESASGAYTWVVPARKQTANQAVVRAILQGGAFGDNTPFPTSISPKFTIQATPPDAYEPNNDFEPAYPIAVGDSVVKNAMVYVNENAPYDTFKITEAHPEHDPFYVLRDTARCDVDVFKLYIPEGKLVTISMFPCFASSTSGTTYGLCSPGIQVFTDGGDQIRYTVFGEAYLERNAERTFQFESTYSGICYVKIFNLSPQAWSNYGLSIHAATILATQKASIDTLTLQETTIDTSVGYTAKVGTVSSDINIDLLLSEKVGGTVSTSVLEPTEFSEAENTKANVKTISILADQNLTNAVQKADVTIPYTIASLDGVPESSLAIYRYCDSTGAWTQLESTVDSVKHEISAQTDRLSILGVFVNANTAIFSKAQNRAQTKGVTANYTPINKTIAVGFTLDNPANAELKLFDLRGKCVSTALFKARQGISTMQWCTGVLGNGTYLVHIKAGEFSTRTSIVVVR